MEEIRNDKAGSGCALNRARPDVSRNDSMSNATSPGVPSVQKTCDGYEVRLRFGGKRRRRFNFTAPSDQAARRKAATMAELARQLTAAGQADKGEAVLDEAAAAADGEALANVRKLARRICAGRYCDPNDALPVRRTFRQVGEEWLDGDFHRRWPDQVKLIDQTNNVIQLETYVFPIVGHVSVEDVRRDKCDEVMRRLPTHLNASSRRHVAQVTRRVLSLAVLAEYIQHNPLPSGWLPRRAPKKDSPVLYVPEDVKLLSCPRIPLLYRVYYGFLHREGGRMTLSAAVTFGQFDFDRAVLQIDRDKNEKARWWKLGPGVADALKAWWHLRGEPSETARVFVGVDGSELDLANMAKLARFHLEKAGVTRKRLFTKGANTLRFGTHSFRHSFVTRSLANGKTDDWVRQRSGHKSNELLTYRESAQSLEELSLGEVMPLVDAIPELAEVHRRLVQDGQGGPQGGPDVSKGCSEDVVAPVGICSKLFAEREGFEPSVPLRVHMNSSHAPSATRSPLQTPAGSDFWSLAWARWRREWDSNPRYRCRYT